jgi:hypothetical protein
MFVSAIHRFKQCCKTRHIYVSNSGQVNEEDEPCTFRNHSQEHRSETRRRIDRYPSPYGDCRL